MSSASNPNKTAVTVFLAALALIGGVLAAVFMTAPKTTVIESGTLLQQPRTLPAVSLIDETGAAFTNAQLQSRWTLIFPGFTYCPDICPTTLGLLKTVQAQLGERGSGLQVLLFSVDPERDTPEVMRRYVHFFSPAFKAATAPEPALREFAQALGVAYAKVPGETEQSYTMDHSAALVLINPRGEIAGYFTPPHRIDALTKDLAALLENGT